MLISRMNGGQGLKILVSWILSNMRLSVLWAVGAFSSVQQQEQRTQSR